MFGLMTSLLIVADRIADAAEAEGIREGVGHDRRQQGGHQEVGAHRGGALASFTVLSLDGVHDVGLALPARHHTYTERC